jgi:hypothetical protein
MVRRPEPFGGTCHVQYLHAPRRRHPIPENRAIHVFVLPVAGVPAVMTTLAIAYIFAAWCAVFGLCIWNLMQRPY